MPQDQNDRLSVQNLQRYLRQLSYHDERIPPPPIDGIFASDTEAALRAFQETRRLPVTGIADRITWEELYALYRISLSESIPPREVALFPFTATPTVMQLGTDGFAVAALQHMLRELSAHYSGLDEIRSSGIYDEVTARAVQRFQAVNRLPVSGVVDVNTWNTITDQYNLRFAIDPFL